MIHLKLAGILIATFMAGALIASPDLRANAANTIFSVDITDGEVKTADLANNSVVSSKIKDGEIKTEDIAPSAIGSLRIKDNDVKAQDLAPDSVGGSEIQGVAKLIFAECGPVPFVSSTYTGTTYQANCSVPGADADDNALAYVSGLSNTCWIAKSTWPQTDTVYVVFLNICGPNNAIHSGDNYSVLVFDK